MQGRVASERAAKAKGIALLTAMAAVALAVELWPSGHRLPDPPRAPMARVRVALQAASIPQEPPVVRLRAEVPRVPSPVEAVRAPGRPALTPPTTSRVPVVDPIRAVADPARPELPALPRLARRDPLGAGPVALPRLDIAVAGSAAPGPGRDRAMTRGLTAAGGAIKTAFKKTGSAIGSAFGRAF